MRTLALLAALLLSVGGLAGCVGEEKDPVNANTVNDPTTPGAGGNGDVLQVLAPLRTSLTTSTAAWVTPGTSVDLSASLPANAQGDVTYTWAIGQHPWAADAPDFTADTGVLDSGETGTITFDQSGHFLLHCHPHPYMKHNVTVIEGYEGPADVTVRIVDDESPELYRFVPENIVVGVGTSVTYENVGRQPHTATFEKAEPALTLLEAEGADVSVTATGEGWMRIIAILEDADGRIGLAQHDVYVADIPEDFVDTFTGSFDMALTPPVSIPGTDETLNPTSEHALEVLLGGRAFVNVTLSDPADGTPAETQKIVIHLVAEGATQDTMTVNAGEMAAMSTINAGKYSLIVEAIQGAQIDYSISMTVVGDPTPPALKDPSADGGGEDDGHGGHAHH